MHENSKIDHNITFEENKNQGKLTDTESTCARRLRPKNSREHGIWNE